MNCFFSRISVWLNRTLQNMRKDSSFNLPNTMYPYYLKNAKQNVPSRHSTGININVSTINYCITLRLHPDKPFFLWLLVWPSSSLMVSPGPFGLASRLSLVPLLPFWSNFSSFSFLFVGFLLWLRDLHWKRYW